MPHATAPQHTAPVTTAPQHTATPLTWHKKSRDKPRHRVLSLISYILIDCFCFSLALATMHIAQARRLWHARLPAVCSNWDLLHILAFDAIERRQLIVVVALVAVELLVDVGILRFCLINTLVESVDVHQLHRSLALFALA